MSNKQIFNPFLPENEYIPDGEPRIFDNRLYVYGSHDKFNGFIFCLNDYVCYSCPVDDFSNWRYEGVIFKKTEDPKNRLGLNLLFAPDVVKGLDGKFYMYYTLGFSGVMGVAVSDTPAGEFKFLNHIKYKDGTLWGRKKGDQFPFDPGVLVDDDGRIYLYSGFADNIPSIATGFCNLKSDGGVVIELESNMYTMKSNPKLIFPSNGEGAYSNHEFYEASSIRKINGKYYFIYSSKHNHELCYATSSYPDRGFKFKGTLVSQGDLFKNNLQIETEGVNYLGNTHGGLLYLNNKWYVFYHRQTNRHSYSRQACAEELLLNSNGDLEQSEVTSCGLNGEALRGEGLYRARIACNLWSKNGVARYDQFLSKLRLVNHPYITQMGESQYVSNLRNGSVVGFKYFNLDNLQSIKLALRGRAKGVVVVSTSKKFDNIISEIKIDIKSKKWLLTIGKCKLIKGKYPLYFKFNVKGSLDFDYFELSNS